MVDHYFDIINKIGIKYKLSDDIINKIYNIIDKSSYPNHFEVKINILQTVVDMRYCNKFNIYFGIKLRCSSCCLYNTRNYVYCGYCNKKLTINGNCLNKCTNKLIYCGVCNNYDNIKHKHCEYCDDIDSNYEEYHSYCKICKKCSNNDDYICDYCDNCNK